MTNFLDLDLMVLQQLGKNGNTGPTSLLPFVDEIDLHEDDLNACMEELAEKGLISLNLPFFTFTDKGRRFYDRHLA